MMKMKRGLLLGLCLSMSLWTLNYGESYASAAELEEVSEEVVTEEVTDEAVTEVEAATEEAAEEEVTGEEITSEVATEEPAAGSPSKVLKTEGPELLAEMDADGLTITLKNCSLASAKEVFFAIFREKEDQDTLQKYYGEKQADGSWQLELGPQKKSVSYKIICYGITKSDKMVYQQTLLYTVEIPTVESVTAELPEGYDGSFRVIVKTESFSERIKSMVIPVWCADDQSDMYWYQAVKLDDTTWAIEGSNKNHKNHKGHYKAHVYITDLDGVQRFTKKTDFPLVRPITEDEPVDTTPVQITFNTGWEFGNESVIHTGAATLYRAEENRKNIVIGVNAGHGCAGGSSVYTYCHPDHTAKVTGGSTAAGSIKATACAVGMTFKDGTREASVTLAEARILRDLLLAKGYDVLMIRDGDDVQLDNIARTVMCNNLADCHIAIHWDGDSLSYDKGCYYMSVPNGLKSMYPVSETWQDNDYLGDCLISGLAASKCIIWGNGYLATDLTQTSYSTIPSVDIELGNQCSDHSQATLNKLAQGLLKGIDKFFEAE